MLKFIKTDFLVSYFSSEAGHVRKSVPINLPSLRKCVFDQRTTMQINDLSISFHIFSEKGDAFFSVVVLLIFVWLTYQTRWSLKSLFRGQLLNHDFQSSNPRVTCENVVSRWSGYLLRPHLCSIRDLFTWVCSLERRHCFRK